MNLRCVGRAPLTLKGLCCDQCSGQPNRQRWRLEMCVCPCARCRPPSALLSSLVYGLRCSIMVVLLHLLAGSAISGLDGLIGAEERMINKPKISSNVVRAPWNWSVCASFFVLFFSAICVELRAAALKPKKKSLIVF